MKKTIHFVYTWKGLKTDVKRVCKHCHVCQMSENSGRKKFELVLGKKGEITMWSQVNVDPICNKNGKKYHIHVMTMVDPVMGWFELSQLKGKPNALVCMKRFDYNEFNFAGDFATIIYTQYKECCISKISWI